MARKEEERLMKSFQKHQVHTPRIQRCVHLLKSVHTFFPFYDVTTSLPSLSLSLSLFILKGGPPPSVLSPNAGQASTGLLSRDLQSMKETIEVMCFS